MMNSCTLQHHPSPNNTLNPETSDQVIIEYPTIHVMSKEEMRGINIVECPNR
jgi:hypothetical protein